MTEPIERDYYAEAKARLQRLEEQLPPDTPDELRRCYSHHAVIEQMAAMDQFPEAFKDMPMSFRMTVKCYEDEERRKQELEKNRPRLLTANPPQSVLDEAGYQKVEAYALAFFCFLAVLIATVLAITRISLPGAVVSLLIAVGCGWGSNRRFTKSAKNRLKWDTTYHTIIYNPALKSGKDATVEIQLEIPVGWKTPETLVQLESCPKAALYELFADSDTVPLRSKVTDCIERRLAVKQHELNLGICRMELLKNVDPAMPPFGSQHVFSYDGTIVTYEIADLWRTDAVNAKLREILSSHPNLDFKKYEKALNILVIDVQQKPPRVTTKGFMG